MHGLRRTFRLLSAKVLLVPAVSLIRAQDQPKDLEGAESRLYRALQLWFGDAYDYLIVYGGYDKGIGTASQLAYHLEDHGVDGDKIITIIVDPYEPMKADDTDGLGSSLMNPPKMPSQPDYELNDAHMVDLLLKELLARGYGDPKTWKITVAARTKEARSYWHSFRTHGMTISYRLPERRYRFWFSPIFQIMMVIDRIGKFFTARRQHQLEAKIELLTAPQTS